MFKYLFRLISHTNAMKGFKPLIEKDANTYSYLDTFSIEPIMSGVYTSSNVIFAIFCHQALDKQAFSMQRNRWIQI